MAENKFKIDGDAVASSIECPVCLNVPRKLPIPQCPMGHIICKDCRPSINTCPTCRRQLIEGHNSTIAASLIDQIPHKCKFQDLGCKEKRLLSEIDNHEKKCPERTVKCAVDECSQVVKLKMFSQHAKDCFSVYTEENNTDITLSSSIICNVSKETIWDEESNVPRPEFNWSWVPTRGFAFKQLNTRFYVYKKYSSTDKFFLFCVLKGNKAIAHKYLATMKVFNEVKEVSTSITCPVLPLEDFPESILDMNKNPSVWKIPFEMMRNLFGIKESKSGNGWKLFFKWKVTMKKKKTVL